jgi:hypothetical protein
MESIKVRLMANAVPIIFHAPNTVDPLNIYSKKLKPLTSKRKKNDEDHESIARIEWEASFYHHDGNIGLPGKNIKAMLINGAKKNKLGTTFKSAIMVDEFFCPVSVKKNGKYVPLNGIGDKPKDLDEIPMKCFEKYYKPEHIDRREMKVTTSKVMRTRPVFMDWMLECTIYFENTLVNEADIIQALKVAGLQCCLGDSRPENGKFTFELIEQ